VCIYVLSEEHFLVLFWPCFVGCVSILCSFDFWITYQSNPCHCTFSFLLANLVKALILLTCFFVVGVDSLCCFDQLVIQQCSLISNFNISFEVGGYVHCFLLGFESCSY
jgi:hypothetical protein